MSTDIAKMSARRKNVPTGLELAARLRDGATAAGLAAEFNVSKSLIARAVNDAGFSSGDGRSTVQLRPEVARVPIVSFGYAGHSDALDGAACVGEDPELWFPQTMYEARVKGAQAKAICGRCPVRVACLTRALEEEVGYASRHGIRGGLDEDERAQLADSGAA
jgi:hypothetical protein